MGGAVRPRLHQRPSDREPRARATAMGGSPRASLVRVYQETASGARADRAALTQVLAGAHRREFNVLCVWSLDRLTREGIGAMVRYLDQLRVAGVRVMSHQEPWLDTGGPVGDLLIAIFAWVAEQERKRIGE